MVSCITTVIIMCVAVNVQATEFSRHGYLEYIKDLRSELHQANTLLIEKQQEILHKAESILLHNDVKNNFNITEYKMNSDCDEKLTEDLYDFHKQYISYKVVRSNTSYIYDNNIEKAHQLIISLLVVDDKSEVDKLFILMIMLWLPLVFIMISGMVLDTITICNKRMKY